jgi:hypothetical protein
MMVAAVAALPPTTATTQTEVEGRLYHIIIINITVGSCVMMIV